VGEEEKRRRGEEEKRGNSVQPPRWRPTKIK